MLVWFDVQAFAQRCVEFVVVRLLHGYGHTVTQTPDGAFRNSDSFPASLTRRPDDFARSNDAYAYPVVDASDCYVENIRKLFNC